MSIRSEMKRAASLGLLALLAIAAGAHAAELRSLSTARDGTQTMNGLVMPLDQAGRNFYLQNEDGQVEVRLGADARIGLLFRERGVKEMLEGRKIVLPSVRKEYPLPADIYVKVRFRDWRSAQGALKSGKLQAGILYTIPLEDHLPTEKELWFSARVSVFKKAHITPQKEARLGDRTFTISTSGHNYAEQIVGLLDAGAIKPFVNQASVYGRMEGDVFVATEVLLRPIPDQTIHDDPALPRYLFIGDSISGNYGPGLREAVRGKLNAHHPPTNCGPSGKGRGRARMWLGDYSKRGRHWDAISFNFGHWDAGNTKEVYQENLEAVIAQLKRTGAKLVWVTTCPVPNGYAPAGELKADGKAPGRTAGVMRKYLNPWAAEVIAHHPEITTCDQWRFVKDREDDLYKEWWAGRNVHFKGEPAAALGRMLAEHVLKVLGQ
ncbi:MAG: SGNH/GDSL hydrolase family protein [Planctomycetota bacterium]